MLETLLASFTLVAASEMGDKTQLLQNFTKAGPPDFKCWGPCDFMKAGPLDFT